LLVISKSPGAVNSAKAPASSLDSAPIETGGLKLTSVPSSAARTRQNIGSLLRAGLRAAM
jgi:hypothetical protein